MGTPSRRTLGTAALVVARVVALAAAVVLAWLNGLFVRTVSADVQLIGTTADRSDYRVAAGAGLATALLLLLGLAAVVSLAAPTWLRYVTAAGVATQLALGVTAWWSSRAVEQPVALEASAWDGVRDVLLSPGSWPLVLVVAAATLRGRWTRVRRRPPAP